MKYVVLKTGKKIEVDDTPYIIENGVLFVYVPTFNGGDYMMIGQVEKEVEE